MNRLLFEAKNIASESNMKYRHGCILLKGRHIINRSCNTDDRTCIQGNFARTSFHAEARCVISSKQRPLRGPRKV